MGKKLAIKGHSTRGNEVIKLLKMMGAVYCPSEIYALCENRCYSINDNGWIKWDYIGPEEIDKYKIFTLEEFLEKYPYKVGDKIPDVWGDSLTVKSMSWDANYKTVMYGFEESVFIVRADEMEAENENKPLFKPGDVVKLKGCPDKNLFWIVMDVVKDGYIFNDGKKYSFDDQHHYEKSNREVINTQPSKMKNVLAELLEHIKTTPKEELEREFEEIESEGWTNIGPTVEEFMDFCNKVNKKPKYPKTYEECCEVLGIGSYFEPEIRNATTEECHKFTKLMKLKRCRDAYWKIAGKEMGLDKPWEPDWNDEIQKYCIRTDRNKIVNCSSSFNNRILAFPTIEMRDAFYENFKDLIEQCKELL